MQSRAIRDWKRGYENIFNNHLSNPEFIEDIEKLKSSKKDYSSLFAKYKLPPGLYRFIRHFIDTNERDPSLIDSSVQIVSDYDKLVYPSDKPEISYLIYEQSKMLGSKEVKLIFDYSASIEEVIDVIRKHRREIEAMNQRALKASGKPSRRRSKTKSSRNNFIKSLKDEHGMKPKEIEKYLNDNGLNEDNLTNVDISHILYKMK